jgi:hypothetical protein
MRSKPFQALACAARKAKTRSLISLLLALTLASCLGLNERAIRLAQRAGLRTAVIEGIAYRHQIYFQLRSSGDSLLVFIEGDGSPWTGDGTAPMRDPTPRRPLALELATRTPRSILFLGRPCYFMVHSDAACTPRIWTSDRYSQSVVESMAAALNRFAADHDYRHTVLVGYSGGGSLAMLMAPHIASITAVVTIAANLDVAAWTRWHDYLPLSGSLDPATQAPLAASIRQLHLVGGRDANVPESINDRFFSTLRPEQLLRFPGFDHVCCWVEQWADILPLIDALAITVNK